MKRASQFDRILLYKQPTDMRKQINGLAEMVESILKEDPFADHLFVFCNKRRDIIRAIYFDKAGFCLWTKKLDKDKFSWLKHTSQEKYVISAKDLDLLLDGVDVLKRHKKLDFSKLS